MSSNLPSNNGSSKSDNVAAMMAPTYRTTEPSATDVLVGRGKSIQQHPGNIRFRRKIAEFLEQYQSFERGQKQGVVTTVLDWLADSGGRVLKRDAKGYWVEVDSSVAKNKVSLAFRHRKITTQSLFSRQNNPFFSTLQTARQRTPPNHNFSSWPSQTQSESFPNMSGDQHRAKPYHPKKLPNVRDTGLQQMPIEASTTTSELLEPIPVATQRRSQSQLEVTHNGLLSSDNNFRGKPPHNAAHIVSNMGVPPSSLLEADPVVFPQRSQQQIHQTTGNNLTLNRQFAGNPLVAWQPVAGTETSLGIPARMNMQHTVAAPSAKQSSELVPDREIHRAAYEWDQSTLKMRGNSNEADTDVDDQEDDILLQRLLESDDQF